MSEVDLSPRGECKIYIDTVCDSRNIIELVTQGEFDTHFRGDYFFDGPYRDDENPHGQIYGLLIKDGRFVYTELHPNLQDRVKLEVGQGVQKTRGLCDDDRNTREGK